MEALLFVLALLLVIVISLWVRTLFALKVERGVNARLRTELAGYRRLALVATVLGVGLPAAAAPEGTIETLTNGVAMAVLHVRSILAERARLTRYIHYHAGLYTDRDVRRTRNLLGGHVNSLSRAGYPVRLERIGPRLDALYLPDMVQISNDDKVLQSRISRLVNVFGDLAEARIADGELVTTFCDQYYHVYQIGYDGVDPTSNKFHKGKFFFPRGAPWLGPQLIDELQQRCRSRVPIVDALWFLSQTAIQEGRAPHGYYDFLDLSETNTIVDFNRAFDIDDKKEEELRLQQAGVVGKSGVAIHNRGVRLGAARTGWHWFTEDYNTEVGRQNVISGLNGRTIPPHGDANEHYALLPNGFWAVYLNNKDGKRQDVVPQNIALDREGLATGSNDGNVHPYMSCVRCHREGLRPVDEYVRKTFRDHLWLGSPDTKEFLQLRDLYFRDMEWERQYALKRYEKSLREATEGWRPEQFADAMRWAWRQYERPVSREEIAWELGVTDAQLLASLKANHRPPSAPIAPGLAGLLSDPPDTLPRAHFEEYYLLLQTYVMPREANWVAPARNEYQYPPERGVGRNIFLPVLPGGA